MEAMTAKGGPKPVPHYLRPSTGSCHNACKHGGHHAFEEKQAPRAQPKPRKKPPPSAASDEQNQKRRLVKARSVSRRRVGDFSKPDKADTPAGGSEIVEWKDIVAYDAVPLPAPASAPAPTDGPSQQPDGIGKKKKRDVMKGKAPLAKTTHQETLVKKPTESLNKRLAKTVRSTLAGKASMRKPQAAADKEEAGKSTQSVKPPKAKKSATSPVENKEIVQGDAATDVKQGGGSLYTPDQEERAAIAESSRAHRRAKSMSISSRSVRFPFTRQASKNSATFKLRSKSSKAPILPSEQDKPTRLRFRKGRAAGEESSSSSGGGIQLRARSLRRRGSGATGTGFMVPEVTLRHQKTLEKKKSRRLSNNLIEETASKLAKSRKSRVKSLVGAFETLISKIGK